MPTTGVRLEILLWRHADAEDGVPDEARRLTARGHEQAAQTARWLEERLPRRYELLVSPATRAVQTAQALRRSFEPSAEVGLAATPSGILAAVSRFEPEATVLVVGHQPTLGRVASLLLSGNARDLGFRKSAVWWFTRRGDETELRSVFDPERG